MRGWRAMAAAALLVGGCEATAQVRGQLDDGTETFTGRSTGYFDRSGWLHVVSNKGLVCDGTYQVGSRGRGVGRVVCRDGRSGPIEFVSNGRRGQGHGTIGGKAFTFVFD